MCSKFFFLIGLEEGISNVSDQNKMVKLLKEKGVTDDQIINKIIEGGEHNEEFWSQYFPEAHQWLIQK